MNFSRLRQNRAARAAGIVAASLAALALAATLNGQPSLFTTIKNFSVPEFYEPPNQNQMKSLLKGAEAEPESATRVRIRRMRLEKFTPTGQQEMLIEAPACTFDSVQRVAFSDGPIKAQTADRRMVIEGVGFLWRQTNATISISNKVHTVIKREPAVLPPSQP